MRRHKTSEHEFFANYLCLAARNGGVGMPPTAADKFVLALPAWAERLQNEMAAADRDYETEAANATMGAMRS